MMDNGLFVFEKQLIISMSLPPKEWGFGCIKKSAAIPLSLIPISAEVAATKGVAINEARLIQVKTVSQNRYQTGCISHL